MGSEKTWRAAYEAATGHMRREHRPVHSDLSPPVPGQHSIFTADELANPALHERQDRRNKS